MDFSSKRFFPLTLLGLTFIVLLAISGVYLFNPEGLAFWPKA